MTTKTSTAQRAYAEAVKVRDGVGAMLSAANDGIARAEQALDAAKVAAIEAVNARCADPLAARQRIETARATVKKAEDDLDFAKLQLQAAEVVERQAFDDVELARVPVIVEEYQDAVRERNDPQSREKVLLAQLTDNIAELMSIIGQRRQQHARLAAEYEHLPVEKRPIFEGAPLQRPSYIVPYAVNHRIPIGEIAAAIEAGVEQGNRGNAWGA
ncbi:hypothetical protein AAHS21_23690 [Mycobacterium sp. 050272]|uniref:hypothetical protein n=1 Tax=Mycobacterium sp. 050272 TaxID=3142488 RepID=UPI00318B8011